MKKSTLLIFDCFGVITSEIAPIWFARRYDEKTAKELKEIYFADADKGRVSIGELIDNLSKGLNIPRQTIVAEWQEIFTLNSSLIELIKELKKKYYVALLSNAPLGLVEAIIEKYDLASLFDKVFISSHYKIAKPDKEFYMLCKNAFTDAETVYMIDDNKKNLDGLDSIGIKGHLFVSNESFIIFLQKEQLI